MNTLFYIALKYIRSQRNSKLLSKISVISVIGIALGIAAVNIALTILGGFEETIKEKTIEFNSHITITTYGNKNITNFKENLEIIKETGGNSIESISPFISKDAIIKSKHLSEGIKITGILPGNNYRKLKENLVEGKFVFTEKGRKGIILGRKLADKLFVKTGDKVTLFVLKNDKPPSPENPPGIEQFLVSGIYESGMAAYDDLQAFISFYDAQEILGMANECSGFNIRLSNLENLDSVKNVLKESLGYPFYVRDFYQINKPIFTWLELQKKPIPIVLGLIILVAVFNIIGTLLMMVLEKTSEIGILKALGTQKKQIVAIFIFQGLYLALLGIIFGNVLALGLSWLQEEFKIISLPASIYFVSSVPVLINPLYYFIVTAVAFLLSFLASFIPSYIAAAIKPIQAIRFD